MKPTQTATLLLTKEEALELLRTGFVRIDDPGERGVIEVRCQPEGAADHAKPVMARLEGVPMKIKVIKPGLAAQFVLPQTTDGQARAGQDSVLLSGEGNAVNARVYR